MNRETKELIQSRARRLAPFLADYLQNTDPAAYEEGHGYRYCFLLLKGPREFLSTFIHGELHLDPAAVASVIWAARGEIPGPNDGTMLSAEREIIVRHNQAVDEWVARNERRRPVPAAHERPAVGLLR